MRYIICFLFCFFFFEEAIASRSPNCTRGNKKSEIADFGKKAMPAAAFGISVIKLDWKGTILSQILSTGLYSLNDPLEKKIHAKRPCGCTGSFPSGHMIMYASSSSYLHYRYGWKYGLPAYLFTIGFAADRVQNKAHSWKDMIGTFAAVNLIVYLVTPKFTDDVHYLPSEDDIKDLEKDEGECGIDINSPRLIAPSNCQKLRQQNSYKAIPLVNINSLKGKQSYLVGFQFFF